MNKLFLLTSAVVVLFVCTCIYLCICRVEALYLARKSQLFFLHNSLTLMIPNSRSGSVTLMPPTVIDNRTGATISWREQIADHFRVTNRDCGTDYSYLFRLNRTGDYTSYVAIVDRLTIWDANIRDKVLQTNFGFDKILLIEISNKNIRWNSCRDYCIDEAMNLWEQEQITQQTFPKNHLLYITLKGNIGFISDFKNKEEFKKMLVLSNEEVIQLMSVDCNHQ